MSSDRFKNRGYSQRLLSAALLWAASSCVLPTQDNAAPVQDIPPGLYTTTTAQVEVPEPPAEDVSYQIDLYWHDAAGQLVLISRQREQPPTIQEVLDGLVVGPTESEIIESVGPLIGSNVTAALNPLPAPVENGVLTISVSDDAAFFRDLGDPKILITEELVCSLTSLAEVSAVRIQDSQGEIPLAGSEAQGIDGPASAADFGNCEPRVEPVEIPSDDEVEPEEES